MTKTVFSSYHKRGDLTELCRELAIDPNEYSHVTVRHGRVWYYEISDHDRQRLEWCGVRFEKGDAENVGSIKVPSAWKGKK